MLLRERARAYQIAVDVEVEAEATRRSTPVLLAPGFDFVSSSASGIDVSGDRDTPSFSHSLLTPPFRLPVDSNPPPPLGGAAPPWGARPPHGPLRPPRGSPG